MKKFILLISVFCLSIGIFACGNKTEGTSNKQQIDKNEQTENSVSEEDNKDAVDFGEMYGYKFAFMDEVFSESKTHGYLGRAEKYDILLLKRNVVSFSTWDNVISDCGALFDDMLYSCLRYSGCKQTVSSSEKRTNEFGEEILWVEGVLEREEGNLDYYAVYYVTGEGKARFAVAIPNGEDSSRAKEAMECLADNLQKAE